MSSSSTGATTASTNQEGYKFLCECNVRAPLRTALTKENVGRRFLGCGNYQGEGGKKCNFFDWFDPETCKRGKEFGNWIVKKNQDLQNIIKNLHEACKEQRREMEHGLLVKMEEWKKKEEWYVMKINLMNQRMKDIEDHYTLKREEWKNKDAWNALEMEEVEATNGGLKLKLEEMEARNDGLVKRNNVMKEEIEYTNLKVKLLFAMVVALVGIGIVYFGGEGIWKNKMKALP
ncbi:hypothetical protein Vadar_009201 [Vaccinium darrowii]|uniref:Uncharacterized protein n=1 Tax=Vaccinium darrowii TaxID=229202 RepID=A0ACB7WZ73_9ERIC|nr:hypothetical protein Vadar_009201 [Vaccinium darrowii]